MSIKFNIGDEVRVTPNHPYEGLTGIVSGIEVDNMYRVMPRNSTKYFLFCASSLIRTKPEHSELDQLLATANAGFEAVRVLSSKYPTQVEYTSPHVEGSIDLMHSKSPWSYVFRKKTPKFIPFTTSNGWYIVLKDNHVAIGCAAFELGLFKSALTYLLNNGTYYGDFHANKNGIVWKDHILKWPDAERLYHELKEIA